MRRKRTNEELRPQVVTLEYIKGEKTSVLFELGLTKVLCVATLQQNVPKFLEGKSLGWITAEYGMLPRCSPIRILRERVRLSGRNQEIQRFIGRSLRAGCDLSLLDGYTVIIDVDVIQADGGTRIASIDGGMIALYILLRDMVVNGRLEKMPVVSLIGAVSIGKMEAEILLDPDYEEDSKLDVDMNVVMNEDLKLVEIDAITEGSPFSMHDLKAMLSLARKGIKEIIRLEKEYLSLAIA
ncbi:ribonuclease PH [candidate division WOR-3 bacterium]|nr:ribonuclease PH [candidate division WOR-3 bacterium]